MSYLMGCIFCSHFIGLASFLFFLFLYTYILHVYLIFNILFVIHLLIYKQQFIITDICLYFKCFLVFKISSNFYSVRMVGMLCEIDLWHFHLMPRRVVQYKYHLYLHANPEALYLFFDTLMHYTTCNFVTFGQTTEIRHPC